jgi:hypothetical protein
VTCAPISSDTRLICAESGAWSGSAGSFGSALNAATARNRSRADSDGGTKRLLGRLRRDSSHSALNWQSASFAAILQKTPHRGSLLGSVIGSIVDMEVDDVDDMDMGVSETATNLVKCAAGCGMFGLPYAYKQGGLYMSIGGTLFFGAISSYTVSILAAAEMKARHFPALERSASSQRVSNLEEEGEYVDKGDCYSEYVHAGDGKAIGRKDSKESLDGMGNLQVCPYMVITAS